MPSSLLDVPPPLPPGPLNPSSVVIHTPADPVSDVTCKDVLGGGAGFEPVSADASASASAPVPVKFTPNPSFTPACADSFTLVSSPIGSGVDHDAPSPRLRLPLRPSSTVSFDCADSCAFASPLKNTAAAFAFAVRCAPRERSVHALEGCGTAAAAAVGSSRPVTAA